MSEQDLLEHARVHVQVAGGLDDADREHLTPDQIQWIEAVDDEVRSWLRGDPERHRWFLEHPTEALSSALDREPSVPLRDLVSGTDDQEVTLEHVAEVARWGEPAPAPWSPAGFKPPGATNDVTFMLSLDAVAKALQAAISGPLEEALAQHAWHALPGLPVSLGIWPLSSRPVLVWVRGRAHLAMHFGGRIKVDVHGHELGLDDIVLTVPLTVEASPSGFAVLPRADEARFGSPAAGGTEDGGDEPTAVDGIDHGLIEEIADGTLEVLPGLGDAAEALPSEVRALLDPEKLEEIRGAVTSWLSARLLEPGPLTGEPLVALLTTLAPQELVCEDLSLTELKARFLAGDAREGGNVPALAIGMGYGEDVQLPDRSLVEHGFDSRVELSNRLLREVVCCLVPEAFAGLSKPDHRTEDRCRWEDHPFTDGGGTRWHAEHVEVSCTDGLVLTARTTTAGPLPGVRVTATIRIEFALSEDGSGLDARAEVDVDVALKWWARVVIGAVTGLIAGILLTLGFGPKGGLVGGAAVGVLAVLVVEALVRLLTDAEPPDVVQGLEDPLRFIPEQLTDLVGDPVALRSLWDDLEMLGRVKPPRPELMTVPDLVGKSEIEAREILGARGFAIPATQRRHDSADEDTVIATEPVSGDEVLPDEKITLIVSKGERVVGIEITVPDVVGRRDLDARDILRGEGFEAMPKPVDSDAPVLEVVGQRPAAGTKEPRGSTVTIFVSKGGGQGGGGDDRPTQPK